MRKEVTKPKEQLFQSDFFAKKVENELFVESTPFKQDSTSEQLILQLKLKIQKDRINFNDECERISNRINILIEENCIRFNNIIVIYSRT